MRTLIGLVLISLSLSVGCKKDPPASAPTAVPTLARDRVYRLELENGKTAKTVGSGATAQTIDNLLADHGFLLWTPEKDLQFVYVGLTGAAGSFFTSGYTRVKLAEDPTAVRLEPFAVALQLRDGRRLELNVASARITPIGGVPSDGVIESNLELTVKGGAAVAQGDTRLSGDLEGTWRGGRDTSAAEVQVVAPPDGLVTGRVQLFFDKPVHTASLAERVFLRDAKRTPVPVEVVPAPTDLPEMTTAVTMTPRALLPFDARLSIAVGSEIDDIVGRRLDKAFTAMFDTPHSPPMLLGTAHDFSATRGDADLALIGVYDFVEAFGPLRPSSGRLLRLATPSALASTASAMITRMNVPPTATRLEIRLCKVARTRDTDTPSLRIGLARPNGVLWSFEKAGTEVPRDPIQGPDGEWMSTSWTTVTLSLASQHGTEALLLIEAVPLSPTMNPNADTQFLIDTIRIVTDAP